MSLLETIAAGLGTGLGGSLITYLGIRARSRSSDRRAEATVRKAEYEHDGRVAGPLLDRVDRLERKVDDCEKRHKQTVEENARQRELDREVCAKEVAAARAEHADSVRLLVAEIRPLLLASRPGDEPTGVHRLDDLVSRTSRSTPPTPAPLRAIPPPAPREEGDDA